MSVIAAIIVAGGTGSRANLPQPKQFAKLGGKRVIDWSIDTFLSHSAISHTVIVGGEEALPVPSPVNLRLAPPGGTRAESVRNGLAALSDINPDYVLIHDAARPGLSAAMIDTLIKALASSDAVAPALPVSDALKRRSGSNLETVLRDQLYRVQTPQAFRYELINAAHASGRMDFVDDLEAVEENGAIVSLVSGDEGLHKITYEADLHLLETRLMAQSKLPRIGTGFDVHAFESGEGVNLCGVMIPHSQKLKGHSDADVAWHALTDALFGALSAGDIGDHFPPSDPQWKGVDSAVFLRSASDLVSAEGYQISNCDLTIICESPKVGPHREEMRQCTADILGIPRACVSVKATTTEKLGFTGRGEGIAAQAAVVLVPKI